MTRTSLQADVNRGVIIPNVDAELAYLLGVFAGDGSICVRQTKYDYALKCVGNPKDEQKFYGEVIGPLFEKLFGLKPKIGFCDKNTTYGLRIQSKTIVTFLVQLGLPVGRKYESLHIPACLYADVQFLLAFIRGLFDTDGCICFKKRYRSAPYYPVITFSSKSAFLVRQIADILEAQGFHFVTHYDYMVRDHRVNDGFTTISRLELSGRKNFGLWMETIGFSCPKHLAKIEKCGPARLLSLVI